jgi:outer membrane protein TolC
MKRSSRGDRRRLWRALPLIIALHLCTPGMRASAQTGDTLRLDLAGAVSRALALSDEAQLAALNVRIASAQRTSARASILPQLSLTSAYTQVVRNARAEIVGNLFGQSYNYSANLNLSQNVFQGGREYFALRSANALHTASLLDQAEVRAALQVTVQRAYLTALLARRVASIQRNGLTLAQDRLAQIVQLEASGRAARYDVLRARVETVNLEPVVLQAENERELAELELRRILNIPVGQPLRLTTELDTRTAQAIVTLTSTSQSDVPAGRATLRAAELTYRARKAGIGVARGQRLPTISVFLRTGFLALPTSAGVPSGWGRTASELCPPGSPATRICQNNGWFRDESFGVQISWALFDGMRTNGDIDFATAQARVAELQWHQRQEQVAVEVARAQAEFARARAAFTAQQTNAGEAQEAFQLASLRFSRGLSTQLEVTDSQLALLTAQTNEARAIYDLQIAAAELARALGKPVPLPPAAAAPRTNGNDQ